MKRSDERLIDLYLDMLAAERGAAANTLEAYRRDLEDFASDLGQHGGAIATAGSDAIRNYLGRLSGRGETGIRAGFRSRWAERPVEVRLLSPAFCNLTVT